MQSRIWRLAPYNGLKLCATGQIVQVRNHVKMYPWRQCRTNAECYLDTTKTPYTDKHNINEFRPSKFQKKPWMKVVYKDKDDRFTRFQWHEAYTSDPSEAKETASSRFKRFTDSVQARGSARERKAYHPPDDVRKKILTIFNNLHESTKTSQRTSQTHVVSSDASEESIQAVDLNQSKDFKSDMITKCIDLFNHDLSSSVLNDVNTIADLIDYYSTPVRGVDPYNALVGKSGSLPTNLTILSDALRFDKETDQYFGGLSALPGIVSEVPGLRARKKYQVLNQDEFQWPDI